MLCYVNVHDFDLLRLEWAKDTIVNMTADSAHGTFCLVVITTFILPVTIKAIIAVEISVTCPSIIIKG